MRFKNFHGIIGSLNKEAPFCEKFRYVSTFISIVMARNSLLKELENDGPIYESFELFTKHNYKYN